MKKNKNKNLREALVGFSCAIKRNKQAVFVRTIGLLFLFFVGQISLVSGQEGKDTLTTTQWGIVNISVCNIHQSADFESPMETQALLGTPVQILKAERWYQVKTPDGYVSFVHRGAITELSEGQMKIWAGSPKIVVASHYTWVYSKPTINSTPVSDVVSGCMLRLGDDELGSFYQVIYPDGRVGYLKKDDGMDEKNWFASRKPDALHFQQAALSLMGIPYLWAGASAKGVDCSGLVWISGYLNGKIFPRNASQQAKIGKRFDASEASLKQLLPGDLVLFGRAATETETEKIIHIGIYLGKGEFLHSQGFVHVSSLDPDSPIFDSYNRNRWLGGVHIYDENGQILAPSIENSPFYLDK